mgnify:CR=1 FL=1
MRFPMVALAPQIEVHSVCCTVMVSLEAPGAELSPWRPDFLIVFSNPSNKLHVSLDE